MPVLNFQFEEECIMDRSVYRKEAAHAQQAAHQSSRAVEKAAWLCVAHGWLSLLRQRRYSDADVFEHTEKKQIRNASRTTHRTRGKSKPRPRNGRVTRHTKSRSQAKAAGR